jgi:hypothetical protein
MYYHDDIPTASKKLADAKLKEKEAEAKRLAKRAAEEDDAASLSKLKAPAGKARKAVVAKSKKAELTEFEQYTASQVAMKPVPTAAELKGLAVSDPLAMMRPNVNRERAAKEASGEFEATGLDAALRYITICLNSYFLFI